MRHRYVAVASVAGIVTAFMVVVAAAPAQACSCAAPNHERQLAETELAFIGTVADIGPDVTRDGHGFLDHVHGITFAVERSLKGDAAAEIEVLEPSDGGACSTELGIGERAAVYTYREGDELATGLCNIGDADSVLAELRPVGRQSTAPARYVVVGAGSAMLTLLAGDGAIVGVVEAARDTTAPPSMGTGFVTPEHVDLCADGVHLVEQYAGEVVVRDLASLDVVDRVPRPALTAEYRCADAEGSVLDGIGGNALQVLGAQTATIDLGAPTWELLGIDHLGRAIVTAGEEIVAVDLASGERAVLYQLDGSGAPATDTSLPQHAGRVMSPDRTRLVTSWQAMRHDDPHAIDTGVAVAALDAPRLVAQAGTSTDGRLPSGAIYGARAYWLDADRLALPSDDGAGTRILSAEDLTPVGTVESLGTTALTADPENPGTAVTFAGARLVAVDLATGAAEQRNTLVLPGPPMALPAPVTVTAELPDIGAPPAPVALDRDAASGAARPAFAPASGRPWLVPAALAGIALGAALVAFGFRGRRRHHDSP